MRQWPRRGAFNISLILFTALVGGCSRSPGGADDPGARPASDPSVVIDPSPVWIVIDNFTFNPAEITIPAGTKVTWVNHDDVPHTATSSVKPKRFDSGTLDTDDQYSHVFTAPGTYDYYCAVHKHMTARIIVK
jgi:plastocyanin